MTRLRRLSIDHLYLVVVAGALFVSGYGLWAALSGQKDEPPIHWTMPEYTSARAVYAPGETIEYTPTLRMLYGGEVEGLRSFWDVDHVRPARLCSGEPAPTQAIANNFPAGEYGNLVTGALSVTLPVPSLPAGSYRIETNVHGFGASSGQTGYIVRFRVERAC